MDHRIQLVLARMEESACKGCPSIVELASTLGISESHLRHLFKIHVGVSPKRYLKLVRLEKLRATLTCPVVEIKQAIAISGFSDLSHAVRDYKTRYGQTPGQTRRLAQCRINEVGNSRIGH